MTPEIAGIAALAVPLLLAGLLFLRKNGFVFLFYIVLCAVGLGYLFTTGTAKEIGTKVLEIAAQAPSPAPAPTPAADPAPAPAQ
ncbi:MAG: hypothetical protein NW216_12075 [Hyphomicrobium sp.]|nr:hypothetical protein [Hyphomicrobium sp.]